MDAILQYEKKDEDDYYAILGCDELSTIEQIYAEYKSRVLSCHPDKHPDNKEAAARFARLQQAKETLCEPGERKLYDCWRKSGLCIPYPEWKARKDSVHTAMHWASMKKKEPMIDECSASERQHQEQQATEAGYWHDPFNKHVSAPGWNREPANDILKKFRSYQI